MMTRCSSFLILCVLFGQVALAEIIPADRRIDWSTAGVSNGIPHRTTICTTLFSTNSAAQIDTALTSCSVGGVVKLATGTFTISSPIHIPSFKTLRGSGISNTVIRYTGTDKAVYIWGGSDTFGNETVINLTGGYTKDSIQVTVNPAQLSSGFRPGAIVFMDQKNDGTLVNPNGRQPCTSCGRDGLTDRASGQANKIVSTNSGGTITLETPLYWTYSGALVPQIWIGDPSVQWAGIEDLTVDYVNSVNNQYSVVLAYAMNCWASNVCTLGGNRGDFQVRASYRCAIDHCIMTMSKSATATHYGIESQYFSSANLFVNNIGYNMPAPIVIGWATSGNVYAYNYLTNCWSDTGFMSQCISAHDVHPFYNLIEGNISPNVYFDDIHGSSSHGTVFRNKLDGWEPVGCPGNNAPTDGRFAFVAESLQSYHNVVGNILGIPDHNDTRYISTNGSCGEPSIMYIGFWDTDCGMTSYDYGVFSTILIHGNYDYATHSQRWDESILDHDIPASLYLTNPPAWFGNLHWPPIEPTNPAAATPTSIPAGYRFVYGADPFPTNLFITPAITSLTNGTCTNLHAWARYPDGSTNELTTNGVTWTSDWPTLISVNSTNGVVCGLAANATGKVTAAYGNITGIIGLHVTDPGDIYPPILLNLKVGACKDLFGTSTNASFFFSVTKPATNIITLDAPWPAATVAGFTNSVLDTSYSLNISDVQYAVWNATWPSLGAGGGPQFHIYSIDLSNNVMTRYDSMTVPKDAPCGPSTLDTIYDIANEPKPTGVVFGEMIIAH